MICNEKQGMNFGLRKDDQIRHPREPYKTLLFVAGRSFL